MGFAVPLMRRLEYACHFCGACVGMSRDKTESTFFTKSFWRRQLARISGQRGVSKAELHADARRTGDCYPPSPMFS